MKMIILLAIILILLSLGSALYFLMRDPADSKRTVYALAWRVGLSLVLFVFLLLAFHFGWIAPHHFPLA